MAVARGGTTCVQLHAITGLASSHTAPFVRVIHDDVVARRYNKINQAVVAVELPGDQELPITLKRSHHVRNEFTACWGADQSCTACLPFEVNWIEVQVWNRFADVAVFLGVTRISLHESRRTSTQSRDTQRDDHTAASRMIWYPLDPGQDLACVTQNSHHLSIQLSISWHSHDERTERIQRDIAQRRDGRNRQVGDEEGEAEDGEVVTVPVIVDPSFRFTEPSSNIEWSTVVGANLRRIFLQGDIDELQMFYEDVLHGDMEQEIEDDSDIVVDEGHLKAFQMCQLSAQYLDHCVTLLDTRKEDYLDHYRTLSSTHRDRHRHHKHLLVQKRRLQKELEDLNLLLSTYTRLHEYHGKHVHPVEQNRPVDSPELTPISQSFQGAKASPARDVAAVVSKKPAFLMTWEEREQERKDQKERDKARRIEDEKLRLQRLFQERQDRESVELRLSSLAHRRRDRNVRRLQATARAFIIRRRLRRVDVMNLAAQKIQAHARRFICFNKWPRTREELGQTRERRLMQQCDHESAESLGREREERMKKEELLRQSPPVDILSDDDDSIGSPNAKPVQALELVAMWKKLKRILSLACERGANPAAVFARLDSRGDRVVDRAEFRLGVSYFGVRMDRKMTRAIISLVRAKCGDPTTPLTLTVVQFIRGFELPIVEEPQVSRSTDKDARQAEERKSPPHMSSSGQRNRNADDEDWDVNDRDTSQTIEKVAEAIGSFRRRVLDSARDHLVAQNKSVADYYAFRQALTHVFEEFDADGNGELDLHELVECMAAINFRVTPDNLAVVRECFFSDVTSESVSIAEFISFALAGMQASSSNAVEEELGILGYKLRDAILGKVKIARKQTESIEEAVRLVFKSAFRTKAQHSCPRKDFTRVLVSLRLGFTPAQLSRLVLRLDQDGDNTVSFDELLTWLRLKVNDGASRPHPLEPSGSRSTRYAIGRDSVDFLRAVYLELAGADNAAVNHKTRSECVAALFRRIDGNGSKKINATELEEFLATVELSDLHAVIQHEESRFGVETRQLAQETMKLIDLNGNGVVTLEEWMGFVLGDKAAHPVGLRRAERYAIVEGVRQAMRDTFTNEASLLDWFRGISGSIRIDKSLSTAEMKVRTREFKNAMRSKLPFIDAKDLDEAIKILDADSSGWITEKEIREWQNPTRDIEELTALITRVWTAERQMAKMKDLSDDDFVEVLYRRFDEDGNGVIARKEVRDGFQSFRITLNKDEALLLINRFDSDRDGLWSKRDFTACVNELLSLGSASRVEAHRGRQNDEYSSDSQHSSDGDGGYDSPDPDHTLADRTLRKTQHDASSDDEDDYSLGELSPPAMSPIHFDGAAVASLKQESVTGGVEYSEDFDETGRRKVAPEALSDISKVAIRVISTRMQRATRLTGTARPPIVASSRTSNVAQSTTSRGDLESPGDASPPGIQFTRGSFSDHLLPLDSPPSARTDVPTRTLAANTSTPSLLRSPTRKRPPPAPTVAPKQPTSIPKKGLATASSILMPVQTTPAPRNAPWRPPSPTSRDKKEMRAAGLRAPTPPAPTQTKLAATIDVSVNPVDALVKKLRQQASELTQVYEQMESKDAELDILRGEIKQLRMQSEMHRKHYPNTHPARAACPKNKNTPTAPSARRASGKMSESRDKSAGQIASSTDQERFDDTAQAMHRMEEALTELRACHQELLGYCSSATPGKEALAPSDIQHEQQLYIRLLEEAIHLKASELCITGHEELLVVLAELRHTIYQQEQEIGELQQQLNNLKSEHMECKAARLEIEDKMQKENSKWEQECSTMRQREAAMQRQLEDAQRLVQTEHMRLREERATQEEQAKRIASLERQLHARTQELDEWETTRSENWVKKESRMLKQTEDLRISLDTERAEVSRTKEALEKSQRQVDELKAMQEGLLQSIDQFVTKEDELEQKIKILEHDVEGIQQLRQENQSLKTTLSALRQELEESTQKNCREDGRLRTLDTIEQANRMLNDLVVTENAEATNERPEHSDRSSMIQVWVNALIEVKPLLSSSFPWLTSFVKELEVSSTNMCRLLVDCQDECKQLRQSKAVFEETFETGACELKRLQAELLEAQTELIQAQIETQKLQFRVSSLEEEAREAQAQVHLRESLAEQIFEQENLLKTQQQRLNNALEQTKEFMELETHLTAQLSVKEEDILHLHGRLREYERQLLVLRELENELDEAASLAEQQNAWNQQLTVELEHLELAKAKQDQRVETLEAREEAFSTRFTTLFSQYIQFVAANKQRLKEEYSIGALHDNQGNVASASIHQEALGSDVLQMLRVFPTLVEEYLASVMLGIQDGRARARGKRSDRTKQRGHAHDRILRITNTLGDSDTKQPQNIIAGPANPRDEEYPLGEQLRAIAVAFNQFKAV